MIIKRNFSPLKVWKYIQRPMLLIIVWTILIFSLQAYLFPTSLAVNFTPIGILGSALAIFVAFRNNSAYGRWWEARQHWAGILSSSRVFARLIFTFADSHRHQENYDKSRSEKFKKVMIYACIGWAHSLRLKLRSQKETDELKEFFANEDMEQILQSQNRPFTIQKLMGAHIYNAMGNGTLGGFDSFQLEGQLLALSNYQGFCEKIKNTPLPRQYDFFTRLFVYLFAFALPFGIFSFFEGKGIAYNWLVIPITIIVAFVFVVMERTGAAIEDPFENLITDVPMTAICNTIERDLKELLGEKKLPTEETPYLGYQY